MVSLEDADLCPKRLVDCRGSGGSLVERRWLQEFTQILKEKGSLNKIESDNEVQIERERGGGSEPQYHDYFVLNLKIKSKRNSKIVGFQI